MQRPLPPPEPAGIDAHLHAIELCRFPMRDGFGYCCREDEQGSVEALLAVLDAHGIAGGLVVQPSGYGPDHACLLDALARGGDRLRGIAAIGSETPEREIDALAEAGVVGTRVNALDGRGGGGVETIERLAARAAARGWWLELHCDADEAAALAPALIAGGGRVLLDHLCRLPPGTRELPPGLRQLADSGRAAVKLSAAYRLSVEDPPWREFGAVARMLVEAFGRDRCVWGSDWPFINLRGARRPGYAETLDALSALLDEDDARAVLCDSPRALFGFGAPVGAR